MKRIDAMDIYSELSNIDSRFIEEADNYSVNVKNRANIKHFILGAGMVAAAGIIAIAGVMATAGIRGGKALNFKENADNGIVTSDNEVKRIHSMNIYASGLENDAECLMVNGEKNLEVNGVGIGLMRSETESSINGHFMFNLNVSGEDIDSISYSISNSTGEYGYSLGSLKEVERDGEEYLKSASERLKKHTENGDKYYVIEDRGTTFSVTENDISEETGNLSIIGFSLEKKDETGNVLKDAKEILNSYKKICDGVDLRITVIYKDGDSRSVELGINYPENVEQQEFYKSICLYIK